MLYKKHLIAKRKIPWKILGPLLILFITIVTLLMLELMSVTHFFHSRYPHFASTPTTGGASTDAQKGEPENSTSSSGANGSQTNNPGNTNGALPQYLITPSGAFVSNHATAQNGSTETSVCNTSPGAICQIVFTKDNVTEALPAQRTDKGGSAYWNDWTPQQYGLTPGSWRVSAIASLGNQTKTENDATPLVVAL